MRFEGYIAPKISLIFVDKRVYRGGGEGCWLPYENLLQRCFKVQICGVHCLLPQRLSRSSLEVQHVYDCEPQPAHSL